MCGESLGNTSNSLMYLATSSLVNKLIAWLSVLQTHQPLSLI
jgi:hypothetical protein